MLLGLSGKEQKGNRMNENDCRIIQVEKKQEISETKTLYEGRAVIAEASTLTKKVKSKVTVWIQVYKNLEQTKRCVENVIKYTDDVDYDLYLVDNGSVENIYEYFCSVEHSKKHVVRITENISSTFPFNVIPLGEISQYFVVVAEDLIVTKNWLSNLVKIMDSDPRIGMVNPMTTFTSNAQGIDIGSNRMEDIHQFGEQFNASNPSKWQERLRLITLGTLYRKECFYAIGWPISDPGFIHDFGDDDIAFRVRRAGYKCIVAGDTWIYHDHPNDTRTTERQIRSIEQGRENFKIKYQGVDAWEDVNNFAFPYLEGKLRHHYSKNASVLGVDPLCGTPLLDIKNMLREQELYDVSLSAFTQEDKYVTDLKTICDGAVFCDREDYFRGSFSRESFDYAIIYREINRYHEPLQILLDVYETLKPGGQLIFRLQNVYSIFSLLQIAGISVEVDGNYCYNYPLEAFGKSLLNMGLHVSVIGSERYEITEGEAKALIDTFIEQYVADSKKEEMRARLDTKVVWMSIVKQ